MAWLLISPVRMFSLKFQGFGWRGNAIRYLFLALCVVTIVVLRLYSIPAIVHPLHPHFGDPLGPAPNSND